MPNGRRMIESCSGMVSPAACDSVESVHDATSVLPLAFTRASYVVCRAWSTEAWQVTGPPSHSRLVSSGPNPSAGFCPSSCWKVDIR